MELNLKYLLFSTLFVLSGLNSVGQINSKKNRKTFQQAETAFNRADYLKALPLYRDCIASDSTNLNAVYKAGLCLVGVNKTDTNALIYFKKSKTKIPESHFYLGTIYHMKDQASLALLEFHQFKKINTEQTISNQELNSWIKKSEMSIVQKNQKETFVVNNLGKQINSNYPEYVPLIWELNGNLIFTSRRKGGKSDNTDPYGKYYEDIYISTKTDSIWSSPTLLSDSLNTDEHDACVAFSSNADELIIYRTDENKTGGDLYISKYENNIWSRPLKLGKEINSDYLETSACFSTYGNEIIFSSNRPGGIGGRDLYRVIKFMNGKYSLPKNLGPEINTPEDEDAPFLDKNDNTLYFSSRGHNSMGEYDIFKAIYNNQSNTWSDVTNMGQPINSTNDDIYYVTQNDKNKAYFASRREGGFGDADLYEVNFSESTKIIIYCNLTCDGQKKTNTGDIIITLLNVKTGKIEGTYKPNIDYLNTLFFVDRNETYEIIIEGASIKTLSQKYSFGSNNSEITIDLTTKL